MRGDPSPARKERATTLSVQSATRWDAGWDGGKNSTEKELESNVRLRDEVFG